jgi:hypothetical protein
LGLGNSSDSLLTSDTLKKYTLGAKVAFWASLWISIGGVGNANLAATTNMEAKPMKNPITTCVESKTVVQTPAHKPMRGRKPRHSGAKTSSVLGKINMKKSVRCGAALLRAWLGKLPQSKDHIGSLDRLTLKSQRGRFKSSHPHHSMA